MPVILPFRDGITRPTALAAPVEVGMMLLRMERPVRQSLPPRESTAFCLAVEAWMVDIRDCSMPNSLWITLASGARQLVVQLALETTRMSERYSLLLTPINKGGGGVVLGGGGEDDLLGAALEVTAGLLRGVVGAGGLDDVLRTAVAPS